MLLHADKKSKKVKHRPQVGRSVPVRILLLADTHLGFDLPFKPRVQRRRRGPARRGREEEEKREKK